jgi:hypothetical protein
MGTAKGRQRAGERHRLEEPASEFQVVREQDDGERDRHSRRVVGELNVESRICKRGDVGAGFWPAPTCRQFAAKQYR